MRPILAFVAALVRSAFISRRDLALENAALRQQLAAYVRGKKCPRLKPSERVLWAMLSRFWTRWSSSLIIVKPKTVIGWHRQGFRLFWRRKSSTGKVGRPRIPSEHIALIKRISRENPGWGEDKIAHELTVKLDVHFLNERHDGRVCRDFVEYYNRARPSQATGAIPDPYPELCESVGEGGEVIALPVLGGVQHDYRRAA